MDSALRRGWAPATAGYHEGKVAAALLEEARSTVARTCRAVHVDVHHSLTDALADALDRCAPDAACVAFAAADSLVVAGAAGLAAQRRGVPFQELAVDGYGRIDSRALAALPTPAVVVTNAVNQEVGAVQIPLDQWRIRTGSSVVLEASAGFGWVAVPQADATVLDPRAWGAPAGAVFTAYPQAHPAVTFDNVPAAVTAALCTSDWAQAAPGAAQAVRRQMSRLRARIAQIPGVDLHGGGPDDAPHILSASVLYVDGEALQTRLDALGFAVGSGSACASRSGQPSHVLAAIGALTSGNIRIGLPPDVPDSMIDAFADAVADAVAGIRERMGTAGL